jgi:hypothetical protein
MSRYNPKASFFCVSLCHGIIYVASGETSQRNDLGRIYTIKFWLTNDNMHVKGKNCSTTIKSRDVTF